MMEQRSWVANAGDAAQVKEAGKKVKLRRENELADIKAILDTSIGRRLIWRYLTECGVFRLSYADNPHATAFNEGRRQIGLMMLSDVMEARPEAYQEMAQENGNAA